jgi:hypothetical protein
MARLAARPREEFANPTLFSLLAKSQRLAERIMQNLPYGNNSAEIVSCEQRDFGAGKANSGDYANRCCRTAIKIHVLRVDLFNMLF